MRRLIIAGMAAVILAGPAVADTRDEVTAVIQSQIDAFLEDDFATAFSFAAPGIKQLFGSSERFGLMVRQGYPMVWRPADVEYLDLNTDQGAPVQKVLIRDQQGVSHVLEYFMQATENGWQINGVRILRAPGVGA
ncbi:MAG: DUF4864 domain-containing protein [Pseudomonadota bacterium]